ncbi:MAG TPA: MarR family transcriptional regulator [Nocardioides sp.]|nr:MarR family transcriptional regulator [Nocardioides sp.]
MARKQPGSDDRPWHATATLENLRSLLEAGARIRHEVSRRAHLSDVELATLERLSHGPIGPAELARHLDVTSAAATGIVDRLSRRGHLERVPDEDDRRRTQLHITTSASGEVQRHLRPMFEGLARVDAEFTPEERAVVERYLRGALEAVRAAIDAPRD